MADDSSFNNSNLSDVDSGPSIDYRPHSTSFMLFNVNHVIVIFLLYALARAIERPVHWLYVSRSSVQPLTMSDLRNCTAYAVKAVVATIALGLQLRAVGVLRIDLGGIDVSDLKFIQLAALLVADLYLFELIYRVHMQRPLVAYNLIVAGILVLMAYVYDETLNPFTYQVLFVFLIQATTDQLASIALMGRHLWSRNLAARMPYFSAVQVFTMQSASVIWSFCSWVNHFVIKGSGRRGAIELLWNVLFPASCVALLLIHMWTAYTVWLIARNARVAECQWHPNRRDRGLLKEGYANLSNDSLTESVPRKDAAVQANPAHGSSAAAFEHSDFFVAVSEPQAAKVKSVQ